jgi:hypothetical protein
MKSSVIAGLALVIRDPAICDSALCDPSGTAHLVSIKATAPPLFRAIEGIGDQRAEFCTDFAARQGGAGASQPVN